MTATNNGDNKTRIPASTSGLPPAEHATSSSVEQAFFETTPESDARAVERFPRQFARAVRRIAPWIAAGIGVVVLVLVAWAGPLPASRADEPRWVDGARASGRALGAELGFPAPGPLKAAVGTHVITPSPPNYVRLAGYGGLRRSVGLDGELRAFALVLQAGAGPACVVMGADLLMMTPALAGQVAAEVNALAAIPRDRILFTASHSHSSLGGYGRTLAEGFLLGAQEFGLETLALRLSPAAWGAVRDVRPAVIRVAQPQAPSLIVNRTESSGEKDATVDVIQLDVDGEEPALLVVFGAHPTTEARRDWMSADYPGPMRRTVSEHVGAFVMFAAGAMGSMGAASPLGARTPENVGTLLASPVMGSFRPRARHQQVTSAEARVACGQAQLPLPPLRLPAFSTWALTERASTALLSPPTEFHASVVVAGPLLMVSLPGELSGEVSLPLRKKAREKGYALSVASFSGEYAGYLLPAERYGKGVEAYLQLAGMGAAQPAVAFIEGLLESLPTGPMPPQSSWEHVWPGDERPAHSSP